MKANDYDNSVTSLKAHFGESKPNCTGYGSSLVCYFGSFEYAAYSDDKVSCGDDSGIPTIRYYANTDGTFDCKEIKG